MKTFKNSQSLAAIEQEKEHAALTSTIIRLKIREKTTGRHGTFCSDRNQIYRAKEETGFGIEQPNGAKFEYKIEKKLETIPADLTLCFLLCFCSLFSFSLSRSSEGFLVSNKSLLSFSLFCLRLPFFLLFLLLSALSSPAFFLVFLFLLSVLTVTPECKQETPSI